MCSESLRKSIQHFKFRDSAFNYHSAKYLSSGEEFRERSGKNISVRLSTYYPTHSAIAKATCEYCNFLI